MWTCANIIRNVVARLGIARGRVQLSVQSGAGGGLRGGQVVSPVQVHLYLIKLNKANKAFKRFKT